jgi:hypothetical protein
MNEAGKRFLHVTQAQVRESRLSAKAKTIGKSDQGSERISLIARSRGKKLTELHVELPLVSIG